MTLERRERLRANPETTRAWQRRSQDAARARERDRPRPALPAASTKGAARARAAAEAGRVAKARDGGCVAAALVPELGCWGPLDPQHVIPRGVRRDLAAEPANIIGCCRGHHEWIEANKARARKLGLHGHDGDDLDDLAARRRSGLARDT